MSTATHPSRHGAHAAGQGSGEVPDDTRSMQIAAAQLRLVTDRRLGKQTPEWVKQLAAEKPHSRPS